MNNNYSSKTLEERLTKLERKNKHLSTAVIIVSIVFCLILIIKLGNKLLQEDEIKCQTLRANRILLIDETLGTKHELDGNGWTISGKVFQTSGAQYGVMTSEKTGKHSYVSCEYGIHGFRMSAWDGKHKAFIARLGDTYPSGNGVGALEIFDRKGRAYFSAVNGKVDKEELSSAGIKENARRHKKKADDLRAAIRYIFSEPQKDKEIE